MVKILISYYMRGGLLRLCAFSSSELLMHHHVKLSHCKWIVFSNNHLYYTLRTLTNQFRRIEGEFIDNHEKLEGVS